MNIKTPSIATWLMISCLLCVAGAAQSAPPAPALNYTVTEGKLLNHFFREGDVAAHLVLRSGEHPRILVAFPAGNSGVGLWFEPVSNEPVWTVSKTLRAVHIKDSHGRPLDGISAELSIATPVLRVHQAVLSSIRELRDYQALGKENPLIRSATEVQGRTLTWSRDRLDGAAGYRLTLEVIRGTVQDGELHADASGRIDLRVTGVTGEPPLSPLAGAALLDASAAKDLTARQTLTFLAYREKLLAGSWRFDTYFGRDTLMSVRLLMPVLSPTAIESALSSVLSRLSPQGEVAHEEDIGEKAVLDHLQRDGTRSAAPVFDYKMIDSSYLLAPVATTWLLHDRRAQSRAAMFLAGTLDPVGGRSGARGTALVDNLRLVLRSAQAFAAEPTVNHLISLKPGVEVGQWRDSDQGLGGGRLPYDVNAVLVPAALAAIAGLQRSGLLAPYESADDATLFAQASRMAAVWRDKAPPLFTASFPLDEAARAVASYAGSQGLPAPAVAPTPGTDRLQFPALALDAQGSPIPIMNSDVGFELLFGEPSGADLQREIAVVMRPFPAGLMTDVGMLIANPAFASQALQQQFSRNAYHGTVIWSWQQALMAAGLARQLQREDLSSSVRGELLQAQGTLWEAIHATRTMSNSELWSWSYADGHYAIVPFGSLAADADESNAAQLWSTVYLAVRPTNEVH